MKEEIGLLLEKERERLCSMSDAIFDRPEMAFEEVFASGLLVTDAVGNRNGCRVHRQPQGQHDQSENPHFFFLLLCALEQPRHKKTHAQQSPPAPLCMSLVH